MGSVWLFDYGVPGTLRERMGLQSHKLLREFLRATVCSMISLLFTSICNVFQQFEELTGFLMPIWRKAVQPRPNVRRTNQQLMIGWNRCCTLENSSSANFHVFYPLQS